MKNIKTENKMKKKQQQIAMHRKLNGMYTYIHVIYTMQIK